MPTLRNSTWILGALVLPVTLSAQTYTVLHNFAYQDGIWPQAGVILGPHGQIYGTTWQGGESGFGTVYELAPPTSPGGAWSEVTIHSFSGPDGEYPRGGLVRGPNGAIYGVASTSSSGDATVLALNHPTAGSTVWPETILYQIPAADYNFDSADTGALVFGRGRSLYGTYGESRVYRLAPPSVAGGAWTEATLSDSGITPVGTLAVGTDGTLYGVSTYGGEGTCNAGCGMVFSMTPPAASGGPWTKKILYTFEPRKGDGYNPHAGLVLAPSGVLYGTTAHGGGGSPAGKGTVFSLTPPTIPGAPMTETILHVFDQQTGDGFAPNASLVLGPNGVLYGTTTYGGARGEGTVFELAPPAAPGGSWTETILHNFAGNGGDADGYEPNGIVLGPNETLYGTTFYGGSSGYGIVFSLRP